MAAGATAATEGARYPSSYRVKLERAEFLELVDIARPRIIYHRRKYHFFAFDGFVIYTAECQNSDFSARVIEAVELSNEPWST